MLHQYQTTKGYKYNTVWFSRKNKTWYSKQTRIHNTNIDMIKWRSNKYKENCTWVIKEGSELTLTSTRWSASLACLSLADVSLTNCPICSRVLCLQSRGNSIKIKNHHVFTGIVKKYIKYTCTSIRISCLIHLWLQRNNPFFS